MFDIILNTEFGSTHIIIQPNFDNFLELCSTDEIFIITDENIAELYAKDLGFAKIIILPSGEATKSLQTIGYVCEELLHSGCNRNSFILGVGGGVITDITGFAASIYKRGVRFGLLPTTLLAQTDAALGGKNGVNHSGIKNIIGLFSAPEFILINPITLKTLPKRELGCGFAEIIKAAALTGNPLIDLLDAYDIEELSEPASLTAIIIEAVKFKCKIVENDSKEAGLRKILNFGHTFGHALEAIHKDMSHGEAVAVGMSAALHFSAAKGLIDKYNSEKVLNLIRKFKLPDKVEFSTDEVLSAIRFDKKVSDKQIDYIILEEIGKPMTYKMKFDELKELLNDLHIAWKS